MKREFLICMLIALAGAATGCEETAQRPSWRIDTPRLLAVRAEPPVIAVTGEAELTALVVDAQGEVAAPLRWRACNPWGYVADPTLDCTGENSLELPLLSPDTPGSGARLVIGDVLRAFPVPPWYQPPTSDDSDMGTGEDEACSFDYDFVELAVVVEADVPGPTGTSRLLTIKRLRVTLADVPRQNPVLDSPALDMVATQGFVPDTTYQVIPEPRQSTLDKACTDDGEEVLEPVRVYVYTTAGELSDDRMDVEYSTEGSELAEIITWTAPADASQSRLWLVAIDNDGGVGWTMRSLSAQAP